MKNKKTPYKLISCLLLALMMFNSLIPDGFEASGINVWNIGRQLSISTNPFSYSKYYNDRVTGLYYLKARYYSPQYQRFTSRDTFDLDNRYDYCSGNPVSKIDPTGHNFVDILNRIGYGLSGGTLTLVGLAGICKGFKTMQKKCVYGSFLFNGSLLMTAGGVFLLSLAFSNQD